MSEGEVLKRLREHRQMHENSRRLETNAAEQHTKNADRHLASVKDFEDAIATLTGKPYAPLTDEK